MESDTMAIKMWFDTFHILVYLFIVFIAMIVWYEWRWSKTCKNNIQVLVVRQSGGGDYFLAPKTGGEVTIKNPKTGTSKTWAINELATVETLYPSVGFVPAFLQKSIRLAIVHEGDWEPLLNRSAHLKKVASPDVVTGLQLIADNSDDKTKEMINTLLDGISTAPTREMIASPAVLGNLMNEKITEAVITVNKEVVDSIANIIKKMGNLVNPWVVYVGLGLILLLLAYSIFMSPVADLTEDISLIKQSLGIP